MDIIRLFTDHHIQFWTTGPNVGKNYVNIRCMFCQDISNHLGFNLQKEYFTCWRCGPHPIKKVLSKLLRLEEDQVYQVIQQYGGRRQSRVLEDEPVRIGIHKFKLPGGTEPMTERHRKYLLKRNFDPERLEREWGLLGTGPVSLLDDIDYKHRIIIPIEWDGKVVSFQSRDITNKHPKRYIVCPKPREIIHHKSILYGKQREWKSIGICVEGVTDVWRLGPLAFATFGTEYMLAQTTKIIKNFKRVFVLYDDEPKAQEKAEKLVKDLKGYIKAERITISGDPGDMKQDDADHLVNLIKSIQ